MNRATRAIIFWSFLILFLVAAPTVVLYTTGYRYSFKKGRVEQVGGLVLKSEPRDTRVTLNGRLLDERTPVNLRLAPDEYRIELQHDGYRSWRKTLTVESRATTFAEDVILWKEAAPHLLLALDADATLRVILAPENRAAAIFADKELSVFDFTRGAEQALTTLDQSADLIVPSLSPEGSAILVNEKTATLPRRIVVELDTGTRTDLATITPRRLERVLWGETASTLYATTIEGDFLALNLFTGRTDVIGRSGVSAFLRGTDIWSVDDTDGQTVLARSRAGEPSTPPSVVSELPAGGYEFVAIDAPYLLLHDFFHERFLLLDSREPTALIAALAGTEVRTRRNRDGDLELLIWNRLELWRANARTGETELLRRQSDHLTDAAWSPRGEYVLFSSFGGEGGRIEALELDNRDERNVTRLAELRDNFIESIATDSRGEKLYFAVTDGTVPGIYELEL